MGAGALGKQRRGRLCGLWCFPGGCAGVKQRNPAAFLSPAACLEAGLATGLWVGGRRRGGPGRPMEPSGLGDGAVIPRGPWAALGAGSQHGQPRPQRTQLPGPYLSLRGPWLTSERGITRMFRGEAGIGGTQGFAGLSQIKFCSKRGVRARGSGASASPGAPLGASRRARARCSSSSLTTELRGREPLWASSASSARALSAQRIPRGIQIGSAAVGERERSRFEWKMWFSCWGLQPSPR